MRKIPLDHVIVKRTQENPKRPGSRSWQNWEYYEGQPTVLEYMRRGGQIRTLNHDAWYGDILIMPPDQV